MKIISVLDTTVSEYNLGNQIIMDAVNSILHELFPNDFQYNLPYIELGERTLKIIRDSQYTFFGGTNSLCPEMEKYNQWGINFDNAKNFKNFILCGLGWWQYSDNVSPYTKKVYGEVLANSFLHSVRDSYTEKKLNLLGYDNVINTGCPTMWNLDNKKIETNKPDTVVLTLTDYNKNIVRDSKLFEIANKNYKNVYYWIQGVGDFEYIKKFKGNIEQDKIIPPRLESFNTFLKKHETDYLGTRLHAGIRALQYNRRAFILQIDNRATELNKDFNIPSYSIDEVEGAIIKKYAPNIIVPYKNIEKWKGQFSKENFENIESFERINYIEYSSNNIFKYIRQHPLFLFKQKFWTMLRLYKQDRMQ